MICVSYLRRSDNKVRVLPAATLLLGLCAEGSVCARAFCCECAPLSATDGYLSERLLLIWLGVNNWLGLQAVMFGLIAEHWWSLAFIFLHISLSLWSISSFLSPSQRVLIRTLYVRSPSLNLDDNPCCKALFYKLSALHSVFCCKGRRAETV